MDPLTSVAASGMRTNMESLDMLANNLANGQTNGYKGDSEFYNLYTSPDTDGAVQMPDIQRNFTDFTQGALQVTSNPMDFGLSGDGFFTVMGPSGALYTRNGAFQMSPRGQLITQDGYAVRGSDGKPIQVDPAQAVTVDAQGNVFQGGAQVGQMQISSFVNVNELQKQGANAFRYNGKATDVKASTAEVQQGKLEASNVGTAESTVRLVNVMRQFEMLQKAVSIGTDMNKQAIEEVAKSGQ